MWDFKALDLKVVLVEKNPVLSYGWTWSFKHLELFHTLHFVEPFAFLSICLFCHLVVLLFYSYFTISRVQIAPLLSLMLFKD